MSDETKKYSVPTIEQMESATDTIKMVIELATLTPILGEPEIGNYWAVELEVKKSLPYGSTKALEKKSMKIDVETGELILDIEEFMEKIWDTLVVSVNPPELAPKRLQKLDAPTCSAMLTYLYKWYKKRIPLKEIEQYKKK